MNARHVNRLEAIGIARLAATRSKLFKCFTGVLLCLFGARYLLQHTLNKRPAWKVISSVFFVVMTNVCVNLVFMCINLICMYV